MRKIWCNILRAAFVLPYTTGLIKERRNGGFSIHDGSIAGVVLLSTAVIIIFEVICMLSLASSMLVMDGLLCLALISLIFCSFVAGCRSQWRMTRTVEPTEKLKLKFLWLFCLGNILFQVMTLAMHIECKVYKDILQVSLYFGITWLFHIFQTAFIHYFSGFRLANVLCLYYGLMTLFLTNIAMWTQQSISAYKTENMIINFNASSIIHPSCENDTALQSVVFSLKPYFEPILLEYCLLSLIFISEMWPKQITHNDQIPDYISDFEESTDCLMIGDNLPLRHNRNPWNKTSICVLGTGLVYSLSFIIIECVFIYVPGSNRYPLVSFVYFFCGDLLRIPLTIRCFYAFSGQLQPKLKSRRLMNLNHFIILLSSVATCGYHVMKIITKFDSYDNAYITRNIIDTVVYITATILQTTFILQMKQYHKTSDLQSVLSVQNTFLFLCCVNFGVWFSFTFVFPQYRMTMRETTRFEHFWFPLVIFYHFECFISFYRFFRQ